MQWVHLIVVLMSLDVIDFCKVLLPFINLSSDSVFQRGL